MNLPKEKCTAVSIKKYWYRYTNIYVCGPVREERENRERERETLIRGKKSGKGGVYGEYQTP